MDVKDIILFFICLNLAITIVNALNFLPVKTAPYTPEQLLVTFSIPDNWQQVIVPSSLAIGGVVALILGYGMSGLALLTVGVLSFFWIPASLVVNGGIGQMLAWLGAPAIIQTIGNVFSAVIWMFFIIEYLGGRRIEG